MSAAPGEKVICQFDEWWNAHGDEYVIAKGERLTVAGTYRVGGALFYHFAEIEDANGYENPGFLSTGFMPLRRLNS